LTQSTIHLADRHIVFEGELGKLRPHSHATLAALWGLERPFRLSAGHFDAEVAVALVPASVTHELDFFGARALVLYFEPHDPGYAAVHAAAAGACAWQSELRELDRAALAAWSQRADVAALANVAKTILPDRPYESDDRLRRLCEHFSRGELLDAEVEELAATVHLSPSRLGHLLTEQLGVGFRRLKQYYRFKLATEELASGISLTTAAHQAGFADSAHFSRAFGETFGLSPAQVYVRSAISRAP
jgi:AraC-like DNA-binding protein